MSNMEIMMKYMIKCILKKFNFHLSQLKNHPIVFQKK